MTPCGNAHRWVLVQPVPWKMRLTNQKTKKTEMTKSMVKEMKIEILNGGEISVN